ncbi:hypothetical protein CHLRE_17g719813v5 [Chlamydomonas reinhardtii]|uniref:Uncharacterized protein n=1 Tax=Chlamydomonas reinhardtii TaxID=3055 RepID=A0A2K3CQ78_CHLRE|nr:uncharacterized protein CHLRE_17g719813v5 [Chlamydomonas reinhardtii]PNW70437.1 hypothetical protein CHLRE_17g719813v5 [Chlamydomonas reinhardtii]
MFERGAWVRPQTASARSAYTAAVSPRYCAAHCRGHGAPAGGLGGGGAEGASAAP